MPRHALHDGLHPQVPVRGARALPLPARPAPSPSRCRWRRCRCCSDGLVYVRAAEPAAVTRPGQLSILHSACTLWPAAPRALQSKTSGPCARMTLVATICAYDPEMDRVSWSGEGGAPAGSAGGAGEQGGGTNSSRRAGGNATRAQAWPGAAPAPAPAGWLQLPAAAGMQRLWPKARAPWHGPSCGVRISHRRPVRLSAPGYALQTERQPSLPGPCR